MNSITIATKGKGYVNFLKRVKAITGHYGLTTTKMDQTLNHFVRILQEFDSGATFPLTTVALDRSQGVIEKYQASNIEFAIHGYYHIDHSQLSFAEQLDHLTKARQVFEDRDIKCSGFRCPYLRWNVDTIAAISQINLLYDSSLSLAWDVVNGNGTPAYFRALNFYGAKLANEYPSLPYLEKNLIRIPYSLPDDEALVDRLDLETIEEMNNVWLAILHRVYELGELFTLGLHPERIIQCQEPLIVVLNEARQLVPAVWIARLDEISTWWRNRTEAEVQITDVTNRKFHLTVAGPKETTVLARGVTVDIPTEPWVNGYEQVKQPQFTIEVPRRPFIGLSPTASPELGHFLRQQGYIIETSQQRDCYDYFFDQSTFSKEDMRPLLSQIERSNSPLVRLGRWPNGARCALAVTGDIDALTLWDYSFRFLAR